MWLHTATASRARARAQRMFPNGVNLGVPHTRDPRGSPFQLPARLADGLGLESDLGHGYPRPCAPSPDLLSEEFGFPAPSSRKESRLRLLLTLAMNTSHILKNSQVADAQVKRLNRGWDFL